MPNIRSLDRSFAGGEISPEMFGRIDLSKFQTGLALAENFTVLPHGPAVNRAGFQFVRATKSATTKSRLIPFSFNLTQTFALEFGVSYIRFHTLGATLESSPGVAYEVATTFTESELFDIHYVQSADVLTLVHPNHAPAELRRIGPLNWTLTNITFGSTIGPITSLTATATGTGSTSYSYTVRPIAADTFEENAPLVQVTASVTNNLNTTGNFNTLSWPAVTNAARYNVYKLDNGLYGYIGQTDALTFVDDNINADTSKTPPLQSNPFASAGNYPAAVTYYEQRRAFAGTLNRPQTIWMTATGTESSFAQAIPSQDDNAVIFRIAAREVNTIRHLVPLATLVVHTASAEWRIQSTDNGGITPSSISAKPQTYTGCNNVQPVTVGNNIVFPRSRGGRINEFTYAYDAQGGYRYQSTDLSLMAPHLFQNKQILDMAISKAPYQILWCVSSDGRLVALTYIPEQQVAGWHHHTTKNGSFESVCVIGEQEEDYLYAIVNRTINGQQVRYVERLHSRNFATQADSFFVDAGASYSGAPISVISSGLSHLENETVSILADGGVITQQKVVGGTITLDHPASKIQIGLPITARLQTLPLAFETMAFGQGRTKNVNKAYLRLFESLGAWVGASFDPADMTELKVRTDEFYGTPPRLQTGEFEHVLAPNWNQNGQVCIEQRDPLPITLAALSVEVAIGA